MDREGRREWPAAGRNRPEAQVTNNGTLVKQTNKSTDRLIRREMSSFQA